MAFFGVTIEKIEKIWDHPNADKLMLAKLRGLEFQFVILKDRWNEGDKCLYFPVDSIIPTSILQIMGLEGKLSGRHKDRCKTIKLRGEFSQGLIENLDLIKDIGIDNPTTEQVTEYLGVKKYEPPEVLIKDGRLVSFSISASTLPEFNEVYDIEGADRYPNIIRYLMENKIPVWISEKIEGTHFSATLFKNGNFHVCTRRHDIIELDDPDKHNSYWDSARKYNLKYICEEILYRERYRIEDTDAQMITIRGEMIGPGIQRNIYKLNDIQLRLFDIKNENHYFNVPALFSVCKKYNLEQILVPTLGYNVLLDEWLGDRTVREASDGESVLFKTKREGIVIKPIYEIQYPHFGRLIIKQRSPVYLAYEKDE